MAPKSKGHPPKNIPAVVEERMDNRSLSSLYIEQDEPTSSSGKTAAAEGRAKVKKEERHIRVILDGTSGALEVMLAECRHLYVGLGTVAEQGPCFGGTFVSLGRASLS